MKRARIDSGRPIEIVSHSGVGRRGSGVATPVGIGPAGAGRGQSGSRWYAWLIDPLPTAEFERDYYEQRILHVVDLMALHHVDPQFLPETDLMPAVLGPFIAGLDTVGSTCAFMLYALLKHPTCSTG